MEQEEYNKIMDAHFAEINAWYNDVDRKNQRLLKALKSVKGEKFHDEFLELLNESEHGGMLTDPTIKIVRIDKIELKEYECVKGEYKSFKFYVNQYVNGGYTGDNYAGNIYVPIKKDKYLEFHYEM